MSELLLSIAMPSYNVEEYIDRGLGSLDDGRLVGKVEVIIVNDGSTDSTLDIARTYADRRPELFRIVDKSNGGHGSAVNAGLDAARGKYFRIIDGDDWVNADELAALLPLLASADVDIVVDQRTEIDMTTGNATSHPFPPNLAQGRSLAFDDICTNDAACDLLTIHGMSVRTDLLRDQNVTLLEKTFYVDYEFVAKATIDARSILFVDLGVYQYLVGNPEQSVADESYVKRWDDHSRVTCELLELYAERADDLTDSRRRYLQNKVDLLVNTHYNIALIFDKERSRGRKRAKEFRAFLHKEHPEFAVRGDRRYKQARILNRLGVDSQATLDKMKKKI